MMRMRWGMGKRLGHEGVSRMKRFGMGVCIIAVFGIVSLLVAQPDSIVINNVEVYGTKNRPAVAFPHLLHMESIACTDCHHWYAANGKNMLDESKLEEGKPGIKCRDCHWKQGRREVRYSLMEAYHLQCMGCHGRMKRDGKKTGPRLCGECHPWK